MNPEREIASGSKCRKQSWPRARRFADGSFDAAVAPFTPAGTGPGSVHGPAQQSRITELPPVAYAGGIWTALRIVAGESGQNHRLARVIRVHNQQSLSKRNDD